MCVCLQLHQTLALPPESLPSLGALLLNENNSEASDRASDVSRTYSKVAFLSLSSSDITRFS